MERESRIVAATFASTDAAVEAMRPVVKSAERGILDLAIVVSDEDGRVRLKDARDAGLGVGAVTGGAIGAIVGLITGPGALVTSAIGAGIGGLLAKLRDGGFEDEGLRGLGDDLAPGTSALVARVLLDRVDEVEAAARAGGAIRVVVARLDADLAAMLDAEASAG
ncbi:MAG: DUF1269 domain-containing protein [Thermoleophilia bacterium]